VIVPPGHVCCFTDEDNNYLLAKPGIHNIQNPFIKQVSTPIPLNGGDNQRTVIQHGNRSVLTVPQGMLGYATDMGQPVLLPPGLHSWTSETLRFGKMYRLGDDPVLAIGPFTLVTVDEGYVGITSENGKLHILVAGLTHLLTHQKWRFDRFINIETQHDDLEKVRATTADNVLINIHGTITWRIEDITKVATKLSENHRSDISAGSMDDGFGISSILRRDVLKQVDAALSTFIGKVNYAKFFLNCFSKLIVNGDDNARHPTNMDNTNLSPDLREDERIENSPYETEKVFTTDESDVASSGGNSRKMANPFFDSKGLGVAISEANQMTSTFGVEIVDVSLISANPTDKNLLASLAAGAVTLAETSRIAYAKKMESEADTIARRIQFESDAEGKLIQAKADADADVLRSVGEKKAAIQHADGLREAARLLETSQVAAALDTLKTSALIIKDSDKFFFRQDLSPLPNAITKMGGGVNVAGPEEYKSLRNEEAK